MRLTREFEPGWRRRSRIDIFGKREHLKGAAEHFGMKQRLQFALGLARIRLGAIDPNRPRRSGAAPQLGDDAGQKMMLIGESGDAQPVCLRAFDNASPIHVTS